MTKIRSSNGHAMPKLEAASTFVRLCGSSDAARQTLKVYDQLGGLADARKVVEMVESLQNGSHKR